MKSRYPLLAMLCLSVATMSHADDTLKIGENIYNKACMMCHASGLAGAPTYGDNTIWAPRLEKGLDALVNSATQGLGIMPAKGGCVDCSDSDIEAAVKYMVNAAH